MDEEKKIEEQWKKLSNPKMPRDESISLLTGG